ncbi:MAG: subtype I-B CRISPR-associated endonuclease Cas1 [Epulopiscium sp. Nele67-Bin004]|nr:MAG: subtype I-B CRISPR-associated endonuclease Cas1 [Epulopiscium sp. Nele67-Bin004]
MGKDYYIFSNGRIKRKDNTIYFIDADEKKKALPIEQVEQLHVFGEVDLNTKLLNYISKYGICINFYNYYGFYSGTYYSKKKNISGVINVNQAIHYYYEENRMVIAKQFIESAMHHMLRNIRRHKEKVGHRIESIENLKGKVKTTTSIPQLMGVEGAIRKEYYRAIDEVTKKYNFEKRQKQPPTDPINTLISFGNSMMYTIVLGEIYKTGLDPSISFLHEPSTKRFSLSLDIAEIFKPLIIDSVIISMINNNQIKDDDFEYEEEVCYLGDAGKKKFVSMLEKKLDTTIQHRTLKRKVSYRFLIRLECYKLIKHIIGDDDYKALKAWW